MARIVITGGAGFLGSHLVDAVRARGDEVVVIDNLVTGSRDNLAHHAGDAGVELIVRDVCDGIGVTGPVDVVLHFASPASPRGLPRAPHPDPEGRRSRHAQRAGPGTRQGRGLPARLDQRGLRRPAGPPAARVLLGPRESRRTARRLRRGEALRRGHDHGLSPGARPADPDRAALQHLRPAHAAERRPGAPRLRGRGRAGPAAAGARDRGADPVLLLRRGLGPRDPARCWRRATATPSTWETGGR